MEIPRNERRISAGVAMTSLVDLTFLLMIFFMVTTTFSSAQQVDMAVSAKARAGAVSEDNLLVRLEERQILLGGAVQSPEKLRKAVRDALAKEPEATVTLAVGKKVAVQFVIEVMDLVNGAGATKVVLSEP